MNCVEVQEIMIDVLYGEDVGSRPSFEFFRHLSGCSECNGEYVELLQTRELLGEWNVGEGRSNDNIHRAALGSGVSRFVRSVRWWPAIQKIAAGFLIAFGLVSLVQSMGYLGGRKMLVSEQQMMELVHDVVVAEQTRERELMFRALLSVKEDVELRQKANVQQMEGYLISLEERYMDNLEENNRYLRTLLSR